MSGIDKLYLVSRFKKYNKDLDLLRGEKLTDALPAL